MLLYKITQTLVPASVATTTSRGAWSATVAMPLVLRAWAAVPRRRVAPVGLVAAVDVAAAAAAWAVEAAGAETGADAEEEGHLAWGDVEGSVVDGAALDVEDP